MAAVAPIELPYRGAPLEKASISLRLCVSALLLCESLMHKTQKKINAETQRRKKYSKFCYVEAY